ncbi:BnaC07g50240D [Brassica napus]|uniref:BnaC07g50240D protein n=1 Tax=Brassica napus TaxID=3708 RepID=A0A078JDU1_BRANA|nr:BnaC07g50240D [Brassica napus]
MIALHSCRLCDAYHQTGISSNLSPWILWGIWTSQNLLLFENKSVTTRSMVVNAVVAAREWLLAQVVNTTKSSPTQTGNETPPTNPDVIYCNTDVAWSVSRRADGSGVLQAKLGWCFKNAAHGVYSEGIRAIDHISSPFMAEALAMREADAPRIIDPGQDDATMAEPDDSSTKDKPGWINAMQEAKRTSLLNVWFRTDSQDRESYKLEVISGGAFWSSHGYRAIIFILLICFYLFYWSRTQLCSGLPCEVCSPKLCLDFFFFFMS